MVHLTAVADAGHRAVTRRRQRDMAVTELGHRIRYFRKRLALTQEALARAANLTPKFVSQIENGRVNPSIGVLERLVLDGFQTTLGVFFMWDPDKADISTMLTMLARLPGDQHRRIVRAIEVLCAHEPPI
jgi:transcriptional regulator with XRE-family HTH domain